MTRQTCPELFLVEAARDGRLAGVARKRFERHLRACPVCAHEVDSLNRLTAAVRIGVDDPRGADELHLIRERSRLLAAFDSARVSPGRASRARRLLWPATVAALVAALALVWRARREDGKHANDGDSDDSSQGLPSYDAADLTPWVRFPSAPPNRPSPPE